MTPVSWRLLDTATKDGYTNMAVDQAIMEGVRDGYAPPTLRFYQWQPKALTMGYFQKADKEIDVESCRRLGIDVVRRLTGGRAVLHHLELTYSMVCTLDCSVATGNVIESYLRISQGLVKGFKTLGIDAQIVAQPKKKGLSAACFDAPSWYELVVDQKKLVGSAQTRRQGIMLQHGSIPFSLSTELLSEVLKFASQDAKESFVRMFNDSAIALDQCIANIEKKKLTAAIVHGLARELNIEFNQGKLTQAEQENADRLREKYSSHHWNFSSGRRR